MLDRVIFWCAVAALIGEFALIIVALMALDARDPLRALACVAIAAWLRVTFAPTWRE